MPKAEICHGIAPVTEKDFECFGRIDCVTDLNQPRDVPPPHRSVHGILVLEHTMSMSMSTSMSMSMSMSTSTSMSMSFQCLQTMKALQSISTIQTWPMGAASQGTGRAGRRLSSGCEAIAICGGEDPSRAMQFPATFAFRVLLMCPPCFLTSRCIEQPKDDRHIRDLYLSLGSLSV